MARPIKETSREQMIEQIKTTARQQMSKYGTAGLSLRGIAREVGVTAPAIYNYFPTLDDLITALIADAFIALADAMDAAGNAVTSPKQGGRIYAVVMAYRRWAFDNPTTFQLIYGNPIPGYHAPPEVTAPLARRPFWGLMRSFATAFTTGELVIPDAYQTIPPQVEANIRDYLAAEGGDIPMPLNIIHLIISGWTRIHGIIMLELTHHVTPVIGFTDQFYEHEILSFMSMLGLEID